MSKRRGTGATSTPWCGGTSTGQSNWTQTGRHLGTARPHLRVWLFTPLLSEREGHHGTSPRPSSPDRDLVTHCCQGNRAEKSRKGVTGVQSFSSWKSQAPQEPGIQRGSEKYKAKANVSGTARPPGGGGLGRAGQQPPHCLAQLLPLGLCSPPWAAALAPLVRKPRGRVPQDCRRRAGGQGWAQSALESGLGNSSP